MRQLKHLYRRVYEDDIYGNPCERHIQDDLTDELFNERYPGFKLEFAYPDYGYYFWYR